MNFVTISFVDPLLFVNKMKLYLQKSCDSMFRPEGTASRSVSIDAIDKCNANFHLSMYSKVTYSVD